MIFYDLVHLNGNTNNYIGDFHRDEFKDKLKKPRFNLGGCFKLINFDQVVVGKFNFKEFLIDKEDNFVEVNAIINGDITKGFIDLSDHSSLLNRIRFLPKEEATQQINDYILTILDVEPQFVKNMRIFMHLGIDDKTDQKIIMSSKVEDLELLPNVFDRVFFGDDIGQKIDSYKKKKFFFKKKIDHLNILDKIFINGLAIKIFRNEVLITQIPVYLLSNEFMIIDQVKSKPKDSITNLVLNDKDLLVKFLASKSKKYLTISIINSISLNKHLLVKDLLVGCSNDILLVAIVIAAQEGYKSLLKDLLDDQPADILMVAIKTAAKNNMKKSVDNLLLYNKKFFVFAIDGAFDGGHDKLFNDLLLNFKENMQLTVLFAAKNGKKELLEAIFSRLDSIDFKCLDKIISIAYSNGRENILSLISSQLTAIQIPAKVKKDFLDINENFRKQNGSWEGLIGSLEIYAWNSKKRNKILRVLRKATEKLTEESSFIGTPKEIDYQLIKDWYSYVKKIMNEIDAKIDPDPRKDIEEKKNIIEALNSCGGAWISHLDQIRHRLIDFSDNGSIEIFICKIISYNVNKVAELINKEYSDSIGEVPSVHSQNKIKYYLKNLIIDEVLDDSLSDLEMSPGQVLINFSNIFDLEVVIDDMLYYIKNNQVFKDKIYDYYKNKLFKDCLSNEEIDSKIEADKSDLKKELKKLALVQNLFKNLQRVLGLLAFDDQIKLMRALIISRDEVSFENNIKIFKMSTLLNKSKINRLFNQKNKVEIIISFLDKIKLLINEPFFNTLSKTKNQLIQSFKDSKQARIEFYAVECFENQHIKEGMILSSGIILILKKMNIYIDEYS